MPLPKGVVEDYFSLLKLILIVVNFAPSVSDSLSSCMSPRYFLFQQIDGKLSWSPSGPFFSVSIKKIMAAPEGGAPLPRSNQEHYLFTVKTVICILTLHSTLLQA